MRRNADYQVSLTTTFWAMSSARRWSRVGRVPQRVWAVHCYWRTTWKVNSTSTVSRSSPVMSWLPTASCTSSTASWCRRTCALSPSCCTIATWLKWLASSKLTVHLHQHHHSLLHAVFHLIESIGLNRIGRGDGFTGQRDAAGSDQRSPPCCPRRR